VDLGNPGAVLLRTTTWDKAPLQGDPWVELLLKQPHERRWDAESTRVSYCDDDHRSAISSQSEILSGDEADKESVITKQPDMQVHDDAQECEEDWDTIIAWAARPATDFAGVWVPASIYGERLFWKEGEQVPIEILSSRKFQMRYAGATYVAELFDDGTLHWDDGDIWFRRDVGACKKDDMQSLNQHATHQRSKFDGTWGPACLKEGTLTWNEGEVVEVEILSDTQFRMVYVGQVYSAELRSDGKLHWSDGDEWSRRCIPHTADLPVRTVQPPWLGRHPQNGQSARPVASCKIAPSAGRTTVGKVPKRSSSPRDTSWSPQPEVTSGRKGDILTDQPSIPPRVAGTTSYAAVVTSYQASSNNVSHHTSGQGKIASVNSPHAAPVATSFVPNVGQSRGRTDVAPEPIDKKRYTGRVSWFRGSFGWVDCAEITTKYNGVHTFLHKNDCDIKPTLGDEVEFRLALDDMGNPKAVSAKKVKAVEPMNARDWFSLKRRR